MLETHREVSVVGTLKRFLVPTAVVSCLAALLVGGVLYSARDAWSKPGASAQHSSAHGALTSTTSTHVHSFYIPILEYHDVAYVKHWPWALLPGQFASEMEFLKDHGFHTVSLMQVYDAYKYGTKLPSHPVVITFDDGHVSNYTIAYPILKKDGFVATEFMVTKAINKKGFLSAQDLLTMQNSGVFAIECHTVNHPYLARVPLSRVRYELTRSKEILTKLLGRPVLFFAYPYGSYNAAVVKEVAKAGFLMAVTSNHGYANPVIDGPLTLRRMSIHEGLSLQKFAQWLSPSLNPHIQMGQALHGKIHLKRFVEHASGLSWS
jgi:peptidoglycan/xylan/chitin deacetylase (PgdA/CDA1 family)